MYTIKQGGAPYEYNGRKLYYCIIISTETSEKIYKCFGTSRVKAARAASNHIYKIKTMQIH